MATKPKRPRDPNQLAKLITGIATGEVQDVDPNEGKDPAAAALGKLGGNARSAQLTPARRAEIAKKAAASRWKTKKE
ncbi:histone H1 [Ahniella affigens]|uniref:Histone H1 n=1 Tax=Ahniella affigens TaxID=2021234 RepID=A0A2P1PN18_9GAMM|nr:histone H1 [Ahniella affigens]AVP96217.1 histone H1 [Ahniella affigens]